MSLTGSGLEVPVSPQRISGEKKTNKHKQLRGIVPEMGGGQIVHVFPFSWGKRETHKQNSQEISGKALRLGQSRDNPGTIPEIFVYVFSCLLVFFPALEYKIPPTRKSWKTTPKLKFGPPQNCPENFRKMTEKYPPPQKKCFFW